MITYVLYLRIHSIVLIARSGGELDLRTRQPVLATIFTYSEVLKVVLILSKQRRDQTRFA